MIFWVAPVNNVGQIRWEGKDQLKDAIVGQLLCVVRDDYGRYSTEG